MDVNFEYYKVFYYVSKYGSLTKAANVLCTSQPALTRTIHKLESKLGCRLFVRNKTGIELTPEGRLFYGYVSSGCAQFFKGESDLSNMLALDNGTIYISATETAQHCFLFQIMEEFNQLFPNVKFRVLNNSTRDSITAVQNGKVDMAIVSAPFQMEKPMRSIELCKYKHILIGGKKYKHLAKQKAAVEELSNYPWVSLTSEAITRTTLNEYFTGHGLEFAPDVELATTDMILSAVRHNLGIGFIPEAFASQDLEYGTVYEIPVEETFPEREVVLAYDTGYPQSIASKQFINFIRSGSAPN